MPEYHTSLYGELARELDNALPPPKAPIYDDHMHAGDVEATRVYVEAARAYGVKGALALGATIEGARALRGEFGEFFHFCGWPHLFDIDTNRNWEAERLGEIEAQAREGFVAMKFKIVPDKDGKRPHVWLDDPRVRPIFDMCERLGLVVQAHIAQPDAWFAKYYSDGRAGRKEEYFTQVEHILEAHPKLKYIGVHMGGWPENLDYLQRMMDTFPGFHIDTSATKWTVRELSRQRERAREFFVRNADRVLFGSDLVVQWGIAPSYYTSRFHVQRMMWESTARVPSMIKDADAKGQPVIEGLGLPADVLQKLYWGNAERVLGRQENA